MRVPTLARPQIVLVNVVVAVLLDNFVQDDDSKKPQEQEQTVSGIRAGIEPLRQTLD